MENNSEQQENKTFLSREELRNKLRTKLNVQSFSRLSKKTKEEQIELVKEKMSSMMKKE
jgi:hypothetical protein